MCLQMFSFFLFGLCENAWFPWQPTIPAKLLIPQLLLILDYQTWYEIKAETYNFYPIVAYANYSKLSILHIHKYL